MMHEYDLRVFADEKRRVLNGQGWCEEGHWVDDAFELRDGRCRNHQLPSCNSCDALLEILTTDGAVCTREHCRTEHLLINGIWEPQL